MNSENLKHTLAAEGVDPKKIEKILEEIAKSKRKDDENLLSVAEASAYLQEKLDKSWNEAKVRRHLGKGIQPKEGLEARKLGYQIPKEELDRFIDEEKMTIDDWKKKVKELEKKIQEQQALIDQLQATKEEPKEEEKLQEKRPVTCSICGEVGHTKRKCPKGNLENQSKEVEQQI